MQCARYGIDAPGLVRAFLFAGLALSVLAWALLHWFGSKAGVPRFLVIWLAALLLIAAAYGLGMCAYMLWGSLVVKVRGRDAILGLITWTGSEQVLDVGCGRGLLLVGAAHRLTTGKAVGIDLWLQQDQSFNQQTAPLENARRERVADRVTVQTGDMRQLPFPGSTFDVVVSSWAVHNLDRKAHRDKALQEMLRVLKPGGSILLNDIVYRDEYRQELTRLGLADVRVVVPSKWSDAFAGAVSFGSFRPATVVARLKLST